MHHFLLFHVMTYSIKLFQDIGCDCSWHRMSHYITSGGSIRQMLGLSFNFFSANGTVRAIQVNELERGRNEQTTLCLLKGQETQQPLRVGCHNPALSPSPWLCPSTNVTLPVSQAQAWFRFPGSLRALQREARLGFELWRLKTWSLPLPHYNSFGWVQQFLAPMPGGLSLLRSPGHKETGSRSLTRILLRELQRGELGLTLPDTRVLSLILSRDNLMTNTGTKWKVGLGLCFCSFPGQAPPSLNTLFSLTFAFLSTQLPTCRGCMSKYIFPFASPEK